MSKIIRFEANFNQHQQRERDGPPGKFHSVDIESVSSSSMALSAVQKLNEKVSFEGIISVRSDYDCSIMPTSGSSGHGHDKRVNFGTGEERSIG